MKDLSSRYNRNRMTLSPAENQKLREQKVCVIGCGGLGGFIIEELGRLGVGTITAVDGDVFDPTNLNRQLLSTETLIGQGKAEANLVQEGNPTMGSPRRGVEKTLGRRRH